MSCSISFFTSTCIKSLKFMLYEQRLVYFDDLFEFLLAVHLYDDSIIPSVMR